MINSTSLWYWLVLMAAAAAERFPAAAGSLDAAKEMVSAVADTTMSVGARAFQIALAAVGISWLWPAILRLRPLWWMLRFL